MSSFDPSLDYDYEDTPRFWGQQEIEERIITNEIEERNRND